MTSPTPAASTTSPKPPGRVALVISHTVPVWVADLAERGLRTFFVRNWFALMDSNSRNYRTRRWLIRVLREAKRLNANRVGERNERRAAERRARRPQRHVRLGSQCPCCGRLYVGRGACTGGALRGHAPTRTRGTMVTYTD